MPPVALCCSRCSECSPRLTHQEPLSNVVTYLPSHCLRFPPPLTSGGGATKCVNSLGPFLTSSTGRYELAGRGSQAVSDRKRRSVVATRSSGHAEGQAEGPASRSQVALKGSRSLGYSVTLGCLRSPLPAANRAVRSLVARRHNGNIRAPNFAPGGGPREPCKRDTKRPFGVQ